MAQMIADAFREAWFNFLNGAAEFIPRFLAMLSLALVGWLIAWVLALGTRTLLGWVKFNQLAGRTGASELLRKTDLPPADELAATIVFWLVWIGFILSGLRALGFTGMETVLSDFVHFVPQLFTALAILLIGLVAANFVWRATLLAAVNAQMPAARLVSSAVRFLIVILAVAMALEQIAVAKTVVLTAFAIAFGAVMFGLALAFGIGGADVARRLLERQFPEQDKKGGDDISHM
jgi:Mechanosensitive ion channel, conserved TM helix